MKYKKKPVVIEAVKFLGFYGKECNFCNFDERPQWLVDAIHKDKLIDFFDSPEKLTIHTLEGHIYASPGDYIIRGVQGEFYPCKPDIFDETYEQAGDGE